jgi:signal transduction histidine kinase
MFARLERSGEEHLELRVAVAPTVNRRGERLTFVVGIPHTPIDFILAWVSAVSVLISLFVFGVSWWSARHVSRYLTAELEHLEASCEALTLGDALKVGRLSELEGPRGLSVEPTQETPRELVTLAHTFNALYQQLTALLSAQRTFIAEAAHELRTPITALRGELELAMRRERSPEKYRETLRYLTEDVRRLQGLSERLLESASSQERALNLTPLSLQACVDEALSSTSLSQQHQHKHHGVAVTELPELILELSEELWVCGERDASVRAIHNLLTNSLKHAHARHLTLSATQRGEWIELSISDDGVGLPEALRGSLFEPFARGSVSAGAGLGLSIVRALMHRQRGEALVTERSFGGGEGAHFTLRWRAAQKEREG